LKASWNTHQIAAMHTAKNATAAMTNTKRI
jgi:hypothetical protein